MNSFSSLLAESRKKANEGFNAKHDANIIIKDDIYVSKSKLTGYVTEPTSTPNKETTRNLLKTINKLHNK